MEKVNLRQHVGVDVSKDDFKACISDMTDSFRVVVRASRTFLNTEKGFTEFRAWIKQKSVQEQAYITMEATGVYYESLAYYLYEQGYRLHVVLPNQAKQYGLSLGIKSKTDKIDAQTLAQMGLERELRLWQPISPGLRVLKQLTRERDAIVRVRTTVTNHLHAYRHQGKPDSDSIKRSVKHISFLNRQIKEIEKQIEMYVKQDKILNAKLQYLQSIPGVGLLTAVIVVAETNGFAAIDNIKQLTSYAGLDVKISESGTWKGKSKISKKGNSHLRKAMYMPSLSKIRKDKATAQFYERLKQKKGKGMIAAVAVQRKLLGLMFSLWKKEEMFHSVA